MAAMLADVLTVALVVLSLSVPVLVAIGLLWLARRRLSGSAGGSTACSAAWLAAARCTPT